MVHTQTSKHTHTLYRQLYICWITPNHIRCCTGVRSPIRQLNWGKLKRRWWRLLTTGWGPCNVRFRDPFSWANELHSTINVSTYGIIDHSSSWSNWRSEKSELVSELSKWESIPLLYDMHIMCIATKVNEVYSLAIKLTSQEYVL